MRRREIRQVLIRIDSSRFVLLLAIVVVGMVAAGIVDLVLDDPDDWLSAHVVFEVGMIVAGLAVVTILWKGWRDAAWSLRRAEASLEERRAERDAWRRSARSALEGLGRAIDRQFRDWDLTPSEREVAMLLVKGYTLRRIAELTDRGERTARQHAIAVYRKAGLSGRAELAAFFLEDLLLPQEDRESE